MKRLALPLVALALVAPLALLHGCVSKGDTEVKQQEAGAHFTCETACEHLQAATFGDCKKWTDFQDCIFECEDHAPTQQGIDCVGSADTCEEFQTCDSTYDVF